MALNFSANQFERPYIAHRLGNWEIPRTYPEHPKAHAGTTRIIANNCGHLLPGEPRPKYDSPWGYFTPTWRMPRRITRKMAQELRAPPFVIAKRREAEAAAVAAAAKAAEAAKVKPVLPPVEQKKLDLYFEGDENNPCQDMPKIPPKDDLDSSYVPGDLTDPKHRPKNYDLLRPPKVTTLDELRELDMAEKERIASAEFHQQGRKQNPFACVYRNFEMAKKCAKENLEHHPLPDTVTNAMYRKLQMKGTGEPGMALQEEPQTTGVGWKGYGASGPTQCTKLRIYRPKTCAVKKLKNIEDPTRPGSVGSFDLKWRFIKQKHVTPIELAICWDMRPENPTDEPKRTPHIDGSNGSLGPAIFAMVHSPKQPQDKPNSPKAAAAKKCDGINGCGTIKSSSAGSHRSIHLHNITPPNFELLKRPKTSSPNPKYQDKNNLDRHSTSTNSLYVNAPETRKDSNQSNLLENRKLHQSSPNLSTISCGSNCSKEHNSRKIRCPACQPKEKEESPTKSEYKMAFKAGKINNERTSLNGTLSSGSGTRSSVKVPKQRDPYAKRTYDINSLNPPFSLWKGTSCQSYPEHWRLASIYQHSYKPVENRKRSLLASVYH